MLAVLAELAEAAPARQQEQLRRLHTHLVKRLSQVVSFVPQLDQVQQDLRAVLPPERQALLGLAWLHRKTLGWKSCDLVAAVPED